jgi:hypothetical protein
MLTQELAQVAEHMSMPMPMPMPQRKAVHQEAKTEIQGKATPLMINSTTGTQI